MKKAIIIATLIAATTAAQAYEITAPPEIAADARKALAIADEVIVIGRRCHAYLTHGIKNEEPCRQAAKAAGQLVDPSARVAAWLSAERKNGATTITGMPLLGDTLTDAIDVLESIQRAKGYQQ